MAILRGLLENREGLTVDDLATRLNISRSAVHQHIVGLERGGFIKRRALARTRGRPGQVFAITDDGVHQFPKRYDWFSTLLLEVLSDRLDKDDLKTELGALGKKIGNQLKGQITNREKSERINALANAMADLGYAARLRDGDDGKPEIQAFNCVYHHLAAEHPEVCEFDLSLIETVTGQRPEHAECMVRGGGSCRFQFKKR